MKIVNTTALYFPINVRYIVSPTGVKKTFFDKFSGRQMIMNISKQRVH